MDAGGTSKRGRRPIKPRKLRFKPKVPRQKPKKSTAQKPQVEETNPVDAELIKTLRAGRGDAKTLRVIKDEQSALDSNSTVPSAAKVSLPPVQPGGQKRAQPKRALQIPRAPHVAANTERFYGYEDDDDEDEHDNNAELPEPLPSSTECESSVHPAKELNLLVGFSAPYTISLILSCICVICSLFGTTGMRRQNKNVLIPVAEISSFAKNTTTVVERNGRSIVKEVKEGYSLNDLPGGYMGKMLVYKSGKVKMKLGDALFDVNPGTECGMTQHAVAMNTKKKHCCQLGDIEKRHLVVTPDVNSLLNDNRI